jgi:hypothetical protein
LLWVKQLTRLALLRRTAATAGHTCVGAAPSHDLMHYGTKGKSQRSTTQQRPSADATHCNPPHRVYCIKGPQKQDQETATPLTGLLWYVGPNTYQQTGCGALPPSLILIQLHGMHMSRIQNPAHRHQLLPFRVGQQCQRAAVLTRPLKTGISACQQGAKRYDPRVHVPSRVSAL